MLILVYSENYKLLFLRLCFTKINTQQYNLQGDSGGPLVCYKTRSNRGLLVGVVSGTQDLRGTRLFSFYTRTSSYVKFIETSNRARSVIHGDFVDYYFMFILNTVIVYCL